MLAIYRILINITFILSPIIILIRLIKKKEDLIRFKEKFCFFSIKKKKGKVIWFHGASVGEIQSIIPLLEKFQKNKDISQILITSNTISSLKIISTMKLRKVVHQFFPIDVKFISKKFLNYWNPAAAFFIDSEIWPNMILNLDEKKIPIILINGRITKKSFIRWYCFKNFSKKIFSKFSLCFSSNTETKNFLYKLGAKKIINVGNLKFTQSEKNSVLTDKNLQKFVNSKKVWCASSTHFNEEDMCGQVHKNLKQKYKNLLTIIIPRHVHRTKDITEEIKDLELNYCIHSSQDKINKNTEIYLVDTYGETKSFFKICKTVFLGGSIISHGGQNPLESIRLGCNIIHGPNVSNFKEIYNLLKLKGLSKKINNSNQLIKTLDISFNKKENSLKKINQIKKIGSKILDNTYREVEYYIKKK